MANRPTQYTITRDIQQAQGTPEHTFDDTRSLKPDLIKGFADSFGNLAQGIGKSDKDLAPLSEAVKEMKEKFLAEQPVSSKKDDYMNQLTRWAYKQGYNSSDISGVMQEYQISDVTEDVNKFLKQSSADAGEKTRLMIEQGRKIDPLAANDDMAIAAFEREMARGYYLDAGTQRYVTQSETDPGLADGTLKELSRDYIQSLSSQLNRAITNAGGSDNLNRKQLQDFAEQRVQELIQKNLPEWYATYVVNMAVYPYKRIADSAGEEREKATKALENYEANLNAQATHDFMQQNIMGANVSNRDLAVMSKTLGSENLHLFLDAAEGDIRKNVLLGKFENKAIDGWEQIVQEHPYEVAEATKLSFKIDNAWNGMLREGAPETQQSITNIGLGMKSTIPQVSQAAIAQGQSNLNAAKIYNAAPDSSIATDKSAQNTVEERKMIQGTLAANAAEEVRVFGADKMVYVNNYGNATLQDLKGSPVGASREQERELRRIETLLTKMSRQTAEPIASLADLHNDLAEKAHGITQPIPEDADKGSKEWQEMTPEQQAAEQMRTEDKKTQRKTPPVPPRKPAEIDESGLMMDFPSAEARARELFRRQ